MKKAFGILALLAALLLVMLALEPRFFSQANLQNLIRWTALFGILSIGVSFVIITGGIDLSIGSVVGLVGALLPWLLEERGYGVATALVIVLGLSGLLGWIHGMLITRLSLQPFVVTLCGLLIYRGMARWVTDDQTQGFGDAHDGLRQLAIGQPMTIAHVAAASGLLAMLWLTVRRGPGLWHWLSMALASSIALVGLVASVFDLGVISALRAPTPFLIMLALAACAGLVLGHTVPGRHLLALGRNEQAARYSGIATRRLTVGAYVVCALCSGLGGVLFAADVNSVAPAMHGNFYELYAIAAAVLGGCSLRGGEGSILGVVAGAAVMRVLYNAINLLRIPAQLEFAVVGVVLLLGVVGDQLVKHWVAARRSRYLPRG